MEQIIILPKKGKNEILYSQVENILEVKGLISIFDEDNNCIGSVIHHNSEWIFRTIDDGGDFDSLEEILIDYSEYTFKLIT